MAGNSAQGNGDGLARLAADADRELRQRWGRTPRWRAAAPGRVNLIGEHTDYQGGWVLPMAIDRHVLIAAAPADASAARTFRVYSRELDSTVEIPLTTVPRAAEPGWANYLRGVVAGFAERGADLPALEAVILSDLPLGAGLASSAALEVATATLLEAAANFPCTPLEKARLCLEAEQRFAGVPCGIMDQLISAAGQAGAALLIDCASEVAEPVALPTPELAVLVCNSRVEHALGDGAYARRRAECEAAAEVLGVDQLRAVTPSALEAARGRLEPVLYRRARHVTGENARTLAAARALAAGDLPAVGNLLYESHRSLREDFEVSCAELDALVELARAIGERGGVWGARLTGGGFGGSVIALCRADEADAVAEGIARGYARRSGLTTEPFLVRAVRGAHALP